MIRTEYLGLARAIGPHYIRLVTPRRKWEVRLPELAHGWATIISRRTGRGIDDVQLPTVLKAIREGHLECCDYEVTTTCRIHWYRAKEEDNETK